MKQKKENYRDDINQKLEEQLKSHNYQDKTIIEQSQNINPQHETNKMKSEEGTVKKKFLIRFNNMNSAIWLCIFTIPKKKMKVFVFLDSTFKYKQKLIKIQAYLCVCLTLWSK